MRRIGGGRGGCSAGCRVCPTRRVNDGQGPRTHRQTSSSHDVGAVVNVVQIISEDFFRVLTFALVRG